MWLYRAQSNSWQGLCVAAGTKKNTKINFGTASLFITMGLFALSDSATAKVPALCLGFGPVWILRAFSPTNSPWMQEQTSLLCPGSLPRQKATPSGLITNGGGGSW